jgi:hypothetical protein
VPANLGSRGTVLGLAWSPDSSTLAFSGGLVGGVTNTGFFTVPTTGGTPTEIYVQCDVSVNSSCAQGSDSTLSWGPLQATPALVTAINAGGDTQGNFNADTDFGGGNTYSSSATVDTGIVTNPAPQAVYQTVRYGNTFSYTLPGLTPSADYTLRLHFNELYWGTPLAGNSGGVGSRVFNVAVNGQSALSNLDVYSTAGGANKAIVEQIPATSDSNGNITVQFSSVTDNAMVNGLELYSGTMPPVTPPTVSSALINSGGNAAGNFAPDTDFSGGTIYASTASVDTSNVTAPAPESVYQTGRYGNFTYNVANLTPNTNFRVRLHFNELYWGTPLANNSGGVGSRVFNVAVNGSQVLTNYDIYQAAGGGNKAVVYDLVVPSDGNGQITIQFTSVTDHALVNGIEIVPSN